MCVFKAKKWKYVGFFISNNYYIYLKRYFEIFVTNVLFKWRTAASMHTKSSWPKNFLGNKTTVMFSSSDLSDKYLYNINIKIRVINLIIFPTYLNFCKTLPCYINSGHYIYIHLHPLLTQHDLKFLYLSIQKNYWFENWSTFERTIFKYPCKILLKLADSKK